MTLRDQEETIEKYLTQQMTEAEKSIFEKKIGKTPHLARKVKLEKQVVEGIKSYQKGILKSRLNQIQLGSSIAEKASASTKVISSTMAVLIIGGCCYFLLNSNETLLIENRETNKITDVIKDDQNSNISRKIDTVKEGSIDKKEFEKAISIKKEVENTTESNPIKIFKKQVNKKLKLEKEIFETEIEVEPPEIDGSEIFFYESLEPLQENSNDLLSDQGIIDLNSDLMVEIEMKKSKKLKYVYSGEKLILIGDFSSSPYQIIEDNTNAKRRLYLYFEQKYYILTLTSERKVLMPVKDIRLLDYLIELRNK
jgi:hypothetical protein